MIRLDFDVACKMAEADLPEGWVIEIHREKGISLVGLFPPNGARQDFDAAGTTMAARRWRHDDGGTDDEGHCCGQFFASLIAA